jgi:hypothetical protein
VRFLPVRIAAAGSTGPAAMEIERGGTTVRLRGAVDREILAQVLESLHRTSC